MRDGGDVENGIRLGQGVVAGVVAERAFVAQRLGRINVAFDDEVGVGQNGFNSGKMFSGLRPTCRKNLAGSQSFQFNGNHPTVTGMSVMVSLPKMSITFTATV